MSKNSIVVLLLSLAVISFAVLYTLQIKKSKPVVVTVQDTLKSSENDDIAQDRRVKQLKKTLAEKDSEIERLRRMVEDASNKGKRKSIIEEEEGALDDGKELAMQKMIENLMEGGFSSGIGNPNAPSLKDKYSAFFESLGLSAEDSDAILELLRKRDPFLFPGAQANIDAEIKKILDEDGYAEFKKYEHELPTRLFVDDFAGALTEAGCPLTDAQLASMLALDPSAVGEIPLSYSPMTMTFNGSSGENVEEMVDGAIGKAADDFSETLDYAEGVLSQDQMEVFDAYIEERLDQKERAAAVVEQMLPGIMNPEVLKGLGAEGSVNSSITIMNEEVQIPLSNTNP